MDGSSMKALSHPDELAYVTEIFRGRVTEILRRVFIALSLRCALLARVEGRINSATIQ